MTTTAATTTTQMTMTITKQEFITKKFMLDLRKVNLAEVLINNFLRKFIERNMSSRIIYCISNHSTNFYDNKLTSFTNFLPKNLKINKQNWEIGVTAFGLDLNIEDNASTNVVQIKSDIIDFDQTGYSSILYTTSLPFSKKNNYFYFNVRNIRYFPLLNTSLKTISVELIDAASKRLPLKDGQPSIVQFHLRRRKRNMAFFTTHIQIDSKMDEGINPQQKNNNFEVHLDKPIYLNEGARIAIADISFPNSISKIPKFVHNKKIIVSSEPFMQSINLKGEYHDQSRIISELEKNHSAS